MIMFMFMYIMCHVQCHLLVGCLFLDQCLQAASRLLPKRSHGLLPTELLPVPRGDAASWAASMRCGSRSEPSILSESGTHLANSVGSSPTPAAVDNAAGSIQKQGDVDKRMEHSGENKQGGAAEVSIEDDEAVNEVFAPETMVLLNSWLSKHPVKTKALSPSHLRIAAANILLQKKCLGQWPGRRPKQLASILLVLYVQEGIMCLSESILGLSKQQLFDLLRDEIRTCGTTCETLLADAAALDRLGETAQLCSEIDMTAVLWMTDAPTATDSTAKAQPASSFDRWLRAKATGLLGLWPAAPVSPSFESARLHEAGLWSASIRSVVRRQLAGRYMKVRILLALTVAIWFSISDARGLWSHLGLGLLSPPQTRICYFVAVMLLGALVIAGSYPTDLHSPNGRKLLLPALSVCAVCALTVAVNSLIDGSWSRHPNDLCRASHALLCIALVANWWSCAVLCSRARATWSVIRSVLCVDGAVVLLANLAMRFLGPPPVYQPRDVPFAVAMVRAATPLLIAALLTARNRHLAAAALNAAGWNHVTVGLTELEGAGAPPVEHASLHAHGSMAAPLRPMSARASTAATSEVAFRLNEELVDAADAEEGDTPFELWYYPTIAPIAVGAWCVMTAMFTMTLSDDVTQLRLFLISAAMCLLLFVVAFGVNFGGGAAWRGDKEDVPSEPATTLRASLVWAVRTVRPSFPIISTASVYMLLTILYSLTLPSEVVVQSARSRAVDSPRATALGYLALGTLVALQSTTTSGGPYDRLCIGAFFAVFHLRLFQLCAADPDPVAMLQLCVSTGLLPFAVGMLGTWLPAQLVRKLWNKMSDAQQLARSATAEAAAEREHIFALEAQRRETLLVRRPSTRTIAHKIVRREELRGGLYD